MPERLAVLVRALAGRPLQVAHTGTPDEPAHTDGETVFVQPGASARTQAIVHALLVGHGGLSREIVTALRGRPERAARHLLLEMSRLCHPDGPWSPLAPRIGLPAGLPVPTGPADSLRLATDGPGLPPPPADWGRIQPGPLRRKFADGLDLSARPPSTLTPRDAATDPEDEDEDEDGEDSAILRALSSPVGGSALSRLLSRLLGTTRGRKAGDGNGDPSGDETGAEARAGRPRGTPARETTWWAATGALLAGPAAWGYRYPEWDHDAARYRPAWCTVIERPPDPLDGPVDHVHGRDLAMRRRLARIGLRPELLPRQPVGDDLDTDALVRARVAAASGAGSEENVYTAARPHRRELSVLVLLDVSGSTRDPSPAGGTVFDRQREAAACLLDSLTALGARTAGYAFHSHGRHAVHLLRLKTFDERRDAGARLAALSPGGYTRLGAAVRHGTAVLKRETHSRRRLLVVICDGFPYDAEYQDTYAERDSRRALAEARHDAIGCLCVSIGAPTPDEGLSRVFGSAAHASVPDLARLRTSAPVLFLHGLRSSDPRRRVGQGPLFPV